MKSSRLIKQLELTPKILWGALLFSQFIFCFLVLSGILHPHQAPNTLVVNILYGAGAVAAFASYYFHKKAVDLDRLKGKFRTIAPTLTMHANYTPEMIREFDQLPDDEKRKIALRFDLQTKMIIACALAESVTIYGLVGVIMGMPPNHFLAFFGIGVLLMLMYFPRHTELLEQVR